MRRLRASRRSNMELGKLRNNVDDVQKNVSTHVPYAIAMYLRKDEGAPRILGTLVVGYSATVL